MRGALGERRAAAADGVAADRAAAPGQARHLQTVQAGDTALQAVVALQKILLSLLPPNVN